MNTDEAPDCRSCGSAQEAVALSARRHCRECRREFFPVRHDQVFCKPTCRRAWHAWREGRGARAVELLIRWRRDRKRGGLAELTAFADELLREYRDLEAGRGPAEHQGRLL